MKNKTMITIECDMTVFCLLLGGRWLVVVPVVDGQERREFMEGCTVEVAGYDVNFKERDRKGVPQVGRQEKAARRDSPVSSSYYSRC
jgi:hypothetical protein